MFKSFCYTALTVAALAGLLAQPAPAQGIIEPDMRWPRDPLVERISSDVTIRVDGTQRIAHVEVEEVFRNRSRALLEGDYLYPIPAGAVFTDFSLFMGETELKGEVLPAAEARRIYEEIVRRKKDPALIELVGHGVLRSRVFPIEPGDTRRVILRYTQVLGRDGELLRVKYPRIVGNPPGAERVERVAPPRPEPRHPFSLEITVEDGEHYATPYSPTHTIDVRERRDDLVISHEGDGSARDFELFLPLRESFIGASVVTHAPSGEDGYFMLVISPPAERDVAEIPRDLTLVLDISGSMSGEKMDQAKAALDQVLSGLAEHDRFRLITFSSVVRSFRRDFAPATRDNIRAARDYLDGVRAEGSTNVADALREALEPATRSGRLSLVLFLTDGKPTVGETAPERIAELAESLRDGERVFTFGVGHDVNTYLLDRMARGGHGSVSYVRPGEDVEAAVSSLTRKISYPALTDLELADAPVQLEDYYPNPIPDLFVGEELVIFGRYRGDGAGELELEGTRAGERIRLTYDMEFARRETGNGFITKLWAARKAGALTAEIRLNGPSEELVEEIRQLGLRYGILTEYSSYLVEEPQFALGGVEMRERALQRARTAAVAPAEQSGAEAFARSEVSAKLLEADRVADFEEPMAMAAPGSRAADPAARRVRHVGRRLLAERDGIWTDVELDPKLEVVEVAPFSDAYFGLLSELPALRAYLALGDELIIGGDGLALKIGDGGLGDLSKRQLRRIVRALEGSL